jgi:hypothetical protein
VAVNDSLRLCGPELHRYKGKGGKIRNNNFTGWVREDYFDWFRATQIVQGSIFRSISRSVILPK